MKQPPITFEQAKSMLSAAMKIIGQHNRKPEGSEKRKVSDEHKAKLRSNLIAANAGRKTSKRLGRPLGSKNKPKSLP